MAHMKKCRVCGKGYRRYSVHDARMHKIVTYGRTKPHGVGDRHLR